jgi:hypothetical protein
MLSDQEHAVYDLAPGTEFVGASQLPAHSLYGAQRAAHRFGDLLGGSALSVQIKEPPHLRFAPRLPDSLHCLPPRGAVCRFAVIASQTSRICRYSSYWRSVFQRKKYVARELLDLLDPRLD